MEGQYNLRSPAVKRLMREAQELLEPTEQYFAQPLDSNLFEWHFTIRGPSDSDFDGGVYHGRIILPPDYPMKPPSIMFLTPNGRFDNTTKICLSISKHHPETWQPSWSIRTALLAIIGFMPTPGQGAIGSLDYTPQERKLLAKRSLLYECPECGLTAHKVLPLTSASDAAQIEMRDLAAQLSMQGEKSKSVVPAEVTEYDTENLDSVVESQETKASEVPEPADPAEQPQDNNDAQNQMHLRHRVTNNNANEGDDANRSNSPPSLARLDTPSTSSRMSSSASCFDRITYIAMVLIIAVIALLIVRRLFSFQYFMNSLN